jgi:hypothetical protein
MNGTTAPATPLAVDATTRFAGELADVLFVIF